MSDDGRMDEEPVNNENFDDSARLEDDEILQVIPLDNLPEGADNGEYSDDEDQQSTSNASAMEDYADDAIGQLAFHEKDCFVVATAGTRWLASGGEDDKALLWDLSQSDSEPIYTIPHGDSVTAIAFNNAATLLASGDLSGKIVITDLRSRSSRTEIDDCSDLEWMFWHATNDILFAGDKEGMVWMWLVGNNGVAQSKVYGGGGGIRCSAGKLLPDGRRLLAGYADGTIRLWSLKDQTNVTVKVESAPNAIDHHATQNVAAVGTVAGFVHLLNTGVTNEELSLKVVTSYPPLDEPKQNEEEMTDENVELCVESLSFGGQWLAVGRNDGSLCVYEMDTKIPRFIYRAPAARAITRVEWSSTGGSSLLVAASVDSFVRIFDARDGSLQKELCNGGDEVFDLVVLQTDPFRVLTACSGGSMRVLEV